MLKTEIKILEIEIEMPGTETKMPEAEMSRRREMLEIDPFDR
jgi:hypothetical protein